MDEANKFAFSFSLKFLFEGLGTIVVHFRMTCGRTGASASLLSCGRKERASLEGGSTRTCSCTRQQEEKEGAAGRIDALLPPAPTFFFDSRHYELRHSWLGLGHYGRRIPVGAHCVSLSMWWRDSLDIVFWSCPIDLRVDGTTRATTRCHFTRIIISRFSPRRLLSGKSTLSIQCVCVFFVNHDNGDLEAIFSPFC